MKELEETNCEIRHVINFELPLWDRLENFKEDLVTTDGSKELNHSETLGAYLGTDCKYAWMSCKTRLVVVDIRCGKCICCWDFDSKVTTVSPFPAESGQVPLLLVGLDNNAIRIKDSVGYLCIFDCCSSRILNSIQVPAGVEKACVINGGTEWEEYNEKRPDTVLSGNSGLIFAALRNLQHIVIDINRSMWQDAFYEGITFTGKLKFVNTISKNTSNNKKDEIHLAYDLLDREIEQYLGFNRNDFESTPLFDESLCTALLSSTKIGCLITGCLGRVIIWQNDGSIGWISPPLDQDYYVTHIVLLEPSDDPRPFCYLWVVCQSDSREFSAVLRMYAMLFNKKYSDKSGESSLYYSLESEPSLKFELELEPGERVHTLQAIERENVRDSTDGGLRKGEDSLLLIGSDERVLLFDLNRWYKEQMPRTMAECRNPNSVMASYRTKSDDVPRKNLFMCSYIPRSLREFATKGPSSPEELFYPNSLTFEWVELTSNSLVFWLARGVQAELLREITIAGPIVLINPTETYRRCLTCGLVPFDTVSQDFLFQTEKSEQRGMLLSICLEQRWTNFLVRCATEWSDGSAAFLYPEFIRWGVERASEIKIVADRLCVPLFDQSGSNIGEIEVKTLRFCCQQIECLSTVISKLPNLEAGLEKQRRALNRIATYLQVLLWFYDVSLLPETQELEDEDNMPQISLAIKIPYPKDKLIESYKKKRKNDKGDNENEEETLFIDQLLSHNCQPLKVQWEREADNDFPNPGGVYPPPSLQTLLRSYLTDCYIEDQKNYYSDGEFDDSEIETKHSITIYLLMDLAMLLQGSHPGVDRLIKYPSAFRLSPSLIKITQAFWLLDHGDYERFFKIMTGPLILPSDIQDWQHKLAVNALLRNDQHKLALMYLRILKPPLSSLEDQGTIISLSVEQGLIESAFHARPPSHYSKLLLKFFETCKTYGKLHEILHLSLDSEEEEAFIKFLKETGSDDTRLLYYLQRGRHTEASDVFGCDANINPQSLLKTKKIHPSSLNMLTAFNATLPDITKRFASSLSKTGNGMHSAFKVNSQPTYPRPMSNYRNQTKEIYEVVVNKTRETCLKADRTTSGPTFLPFLGAPCSTIVYCTKVMGSNTGQELNEANNVLFPVKKVFHISSKRGRGTLNEKEDEFCEIERKRRRLESRSEMDLSRGDNDTQMSRRLSMSQVCNTPLVQRKHQPEDSKISLVAETPHSILKIRQMIKNKSGSPGFDFENETMSEKQAILRRTPAGDIRPARQIRFSMDRLSINDDSVFSTNGSNRDENEQDSNNTGSSKHTEEESNMEDTYYSPNVSVKSFRESSILSDSSMTKVIGGPRPRPALRRSSLLSRASSDRNSMSSENTTAGQSALDTSFDKKSLNSSNISHKTAQSPSLYSASILSANTSVDESPIKRPLALNNNKPKDDESEESEEESEVESKIVTEDKNDIDKDASVNAVEFEYEGMEVDEYSERQGEVSEHAQETKYNEFGTQDEDEDENESHRESEISEDEEELKNGEKTKEFEKNAQKHEDSVFYSRETPVDEEKEIYVDPDDSFQSCPSSPLESVHNSHIDLDKSIQQESSNFSFVKETHVTRKISVHTYENYSLTEKFSVERTHETYDSESDNYSLTKPIFLDNRGILKFGGPVDDVVITDDESLEVEMKVPKLSFTAQTEEEEEDEEHDDEEQDERNFTLNLSSSEKSAESVENKTKDQLEKSPKSNELQVNANKTSTMEIMSVSDNEQSLQSKNDSRSRMSSRSSTKGDDLDGDSLETSPASASSRKKIASARRSIHSRTPPKIFITKVQEFSKTEETKEFNTDEEEEPEESKGSEKSRKYNVELSQNIEAPQDELSDELVKKTTASKENITKATTKMSSRAKQKDKSTSELLDTTAMMRTRSTRAGSVVKDTSPKKEAVKPARKTRAASVTLETTAQEDSEEVEKTSRNKGSRASSMVKDDTALEASNKHEESVSKKKINSTRTTRASSMAKESISEPIESEEVVKRRPGRPKTTRASAIAKDTSKTEKSTERDEEEDQKDEKLSTSRTTRASSLAKDIVTRKTKAGSVTKEEGKSVPLAVKKTRALSISKETAIEEEDKPITPRRSTRAASIAKESVIEEEVKLTPKRATRATSVAKEEETNLTPKRTTRASSLAEELVEEEAKSTPKRLTRASSEAKDMSVMEVDEPTNKRTTRKRGGSVPKEIATRLDSSRLQARNRRSTSLLKEVIPEETLPLTSAKVPRISDVASSSPATNTRSRRSSIQSAPDEIEPIQEDLRSRRAASVDSTAIPGKRVTRSVKAKSSIIPEVIPEESPAAVKSKRPVTRRKKSASDVVEETKVASKPKRGRKPSESKDFQFSPPEEAGEDLQSDEDVSRTPVYNFSKPADLQKFISHLGDDEDSFDVSTNALIPDKLDSERKKFARIQRRPRDCFVLPSRRNKKPS